MAKVKVEKLTKEQMIKLMIGWANAHPEDVHPWVDKPSMEESLVKLCNDALYAAGRDDWGACVLCRS